MSSILQKPDMNKIFLIYGRLDDMFITKNLQKSNFRPFLNSYLKSLGYEQIVYYSGAKNVGKFVLDDESAILAINKNKKYRPDLEKRLEERKAAAKAASAQAASQQTTSQQEASQQTASQQVSSQGTSQSAAVQNSTAQSSAAAVQNSSAQISSAQTGSASGTSGSSSSAGRKHRILSPKAKMKAKESENNTAAATAGNSAAGTSAATSVATPTATPAAAPVASSASAAYSASSPVLVSGTEVNATGSTTANTAGSDPVYTDLVYSQPKITPVEFLDDAKKMMADSTHKSAVIFTFFQDFFTDRSAPLQPYLELVSHLWDEYRSTGNENICIFLAPSMSDADLSTMFDNMENGYVLKNRFFNESGTINHKTTIQVGLPNRDEVSYMMEYLRIVGDGGKRLVFKESEKKKMVSSIMYLSREAERDENRSGYLHAIYNTVADYMHSVPGKAAAIDDDVIQSLYSKYKNAEEEDPLEKLKNTAGWESVADRIEEIIQDYRIKKSEAARKNQAAVGYAAGQAAGLSLGSGSPVNRGSRNLQTIGDSNTEISGNIFRGCINERIDKEEVAASFNYVVPHFVLRGNPGVGKTTVARLIGQIFYNEGILLKGNTIEAKRDDLVGQYIGETAIKTTRCVESAQDGVLFIDDAYSLLEKGEGHNYAKEAIDTLVPIMTNPDKYRLCIIMAGYPKPMDELLEMNAGLRSRFSKANILTIEDYKPELLKSIFVGSCKKDGYHFPDDNSKDALDLDLFFTNMYNQRNKADFGNARDIVAIAKEVKMQCSLRDDTVRCIKKEDFGDYAKFFVKKGVSSIDEIYARIDKYVGMGFVKDLFKNIRYEVLDNQENKKRGIAPESYPDHYIFAGNPGTGKTTVGKMIGEFYHMMGVLGADETLFVDASEIIGSHVGESKDKINEVMQKAIDHSQVLYIDEAYQISESAYGPEIIGAMMTKMTENAEDFKVIFGMYSNRVEAFLKMNAGLSRRLRIVNFPDYTPDQLLEIFDRTIKEQGCTITDDAHKLVKLILTRKYNIRGEDFGNAGEVKKMVVDMKHLRIGRVYSSNNAAIDSVGSDAYRYTYTVDDIPESLKKTVEDQINPRTLDDIMEELNRQIGLDELKDIVVRKQEELLFAIKSGESVDDIRPGYYFFVGNPGTGKSTSAKLFGECLQQLGIVKTNNFYSCTAKDLIGQYVGETDKKTYALLQKSVNAVLFIDEAYSLSYAGSNESANYKKEALEQIIAFMDEPEHRRSCCLIFAGYEKDMQGLYKSNSGMRSRIEEVHFRDYTAEETYDIFELFCKKGGFTVSEGVRDIYVPIFEELKKLEYFSNGRTARTIFEKTTEKLKRRVVRSDNIAAGEEKLIIKDDLLNVNEAVSVIGGDEAPGNKNPLDVWKPDFNPNLL